MSGYVAASVANAARAKRRARNAASSDTPAAPVRTIAWSTQTKTATKKKVAAVKAPVVVLPTRTEKLNDLIQTLVNVHNGTDLLFGYPKDCVDWPALLAQLEGANGA